MLSWLNWVGEADQMSDNPDSTEPKLVQIGKDQISETVVMAPLRERPNTGLDDLHNWLMLAGLDIWDAARTSTTPYEADPLHKTNHFEDALDVYAAFDGPLDHQDPNALTTAQNIYHTGRLTWLLSNEPWQMVANLAEWLAAEGQFGLNDVTTLFTLHTTSLLLANMENRAQFARNLDSNCITEIAESQANDRPFHRFIANSLALEKVMPGKHRKVLQAMSQRLKTLQPPSGPSNPKVIRSYTTKLSEIEGIDSSLWAPWLRPDTPEFNVEQPHPTKPPNQPDPKTQKPPHH